MKNLNIRNLTSNVEAALSSYLSTPDGSWGQSAQAWGRLTDALPLYRGNTRLNVAKLANRLAADAIAAGWNHHPSRAV